MREKRRCLSSAVWALSCGTALVSIALGMVGCADNRCCVEPTPGQSARIGTASGCIEKVVFRGTALLTPDGELIIAEPGESPEDLLAYAKKPPVASAAGGDDSDDCPGGCITIVTFSTNGDPMATAHCEAKTCKPECNLLTGSTSSGTTFRCCCSAATGGG